MMQVRKGSRTRLSVFLTLAILLGSAPAFADDMPAPTLGDTENPAPSLGKDAASPAPSSPAATPAPAAEPEKATKVQIPSDQPSSPEAQPAVPVESIPGKTTGSPKGVPLEDNKRDIYDQYYDYLDQQKDEQASQKKEDQRTYFPHEDGAWQIELSYSRNALSGYNFNYKNYVNPATGTATTINATSQGGNLLLTWFPLRSLTFGRLGLGAVGGVFWSQLSTPTLGTDANGNAIVIATSATPQNIITYGLRAVYELDYVLGQMFVPYAMVGVDQVQIQAYSVSAQSPTSATTVNTYMNAPKRNLTSQYFGGGIRFNLNRLEPMAASRALVTVGVRKFYISYMATERTGAAAGLTHNLGLTFEF